MNKRSYDEKEFYFGNFVITSREIIASISIVAVMILIGVLIGEKISEHHADQVEIYNKAAKIESSELFRYGMDTNIGNAFVYGELEAVDTVTYPEIGGEYMSVSKCKEVYTRHTRTVYEYDDDGNVTGSHEEVYYTWDVVNRDGITCNFVNFCGERFLYGQIYIPNEKYINTIYDNFDRDIRYVYYGSDIKFTGTLFTSLRDGTVSKDTNFYIGLTIQETIEYLQINGGLIAFWIVWVVLIIGMIITFFYFENRWLE